MIRTPQELDDAWFALKLFIRAGFEPFPLKHYKATMPSGVAGGKTPRDTGWSTNDYTRFDFKDWMRRGGNVGFRLLANQVVVDVDPRSDGFQSLKALFWDAPEFEEALARAPRTVSGRGDGGVHYYFSKDPDIRTRVNTPEYPGIDFKRGVGLVVAPGSLHPDTGKAYVFDLQGTRPAAMEALPDSVVNLLRIPDEPAKGPRGLSGVITPQKLKLLLGALPATDYGQGGKYHDEWLNIAMACHDGTNGEGEPEWLEWCATDPQYGEQSSPRNHLRWLSFEAGKKGRRHTYKTLLRAVARENRPDLVALIPGEDVQFEDDDDDLPVVEE